ncbi:UNVERIFIED_CONTAM: hypothetical protein LK11_48210 [Mumia flava]
MSRAAAESRHWRASGVLVLAAWGALILNVLSFNASVALVPVPQSLGQMITMGALPFALLFALMANPRVIVRPHMFMLLVTLLAVVALMVSLHNDFMVGSTFRAVRMLGFVAVLWLLTPWWGRRDMLLLRCHRTWLWAVLASVVLGALVAPGKAFEFEGRLAGVLWPIWPTQVAHYAAVLFGTTALLWLCRLISGRYAVFALTVTGAILILTHTRTALLAVGVGLTLAAATLFLGHARVRRTSLLGVVTVLLLATVFASQLTSWALRGQTPEEAGNLTGRTKVWEAVVDQQRSIVGDLFGSGMSDQSFEGLPIDSNWVATFFDQGWFGVVIEVVIILLLLLMAATRERGPHRAIALFLVVYCMIASITETGLGIPSPYLLELTIAASLLTYQPRGPR